MALKIDALNYGSVALCPHLAYMMTCANDVFFSSNSRADPRSKGGHVLSLFFFLFYWGRIFVCIFFMLSTRCRSSGLGTRDPPRDLSLLCFSCRGHTAPANCGTCLLPEEWYVICFFLQAPLHIIQYVPIFLRSGISNFNRTLAIMFMFSPLLRKPGQICC